MKRSLRRSGPLSVLSADSATSTPVSSAYPSAYPSEDEEAPKEKVKPFKFLELPSELRTKIYDLLFISVPDTLDLDPDNFRSVHRKLAIFYVSKQIHDEASHRFYSTHTIRLFPCHPGRFFKTKKPLLARLSPRCRSSITSFELRLGPGFAAPPRGWVVNEALGLKDAVSVRVLKVMVQVDTSNPIFNGFRGGDDDFYQAFSKNLLTQVIKSVPSIVEVQFDAWSSVRKDGAMLKTLVRVAREHKKVISWGPEISASDQGDDGDWTDILLAEPSLLSALPDIPVVA